MDGNHLNRLGTIPERQRSAGMTSQPLRRLLRPFLFIVLLACLGVFGFSGIWLPLHSTATISLAPTRPPMRWRIMLRSRSTMCRCSASSTTRCYICPLGRQTSAGLRPQPRCSSRSGSSRIRWRAFSGGALAGGAAGESLAAGALRDDTARKAGRVIPTWTMGLTLLGAAALAQPVTDSLRLGQSTTFCCWGSRWSPMAWWKIAR